MAITTQPIGSIGLIRGYATGEARPNVIYKLPPAPYGWAVSASGSGTVTIEFLHPSTGTVLDSFAGSRNHTATRTNATQERQEVATTLGIGIRFTGVSSLYGVGIAPIGADGDAYATPPTL